MNHKMERYINRQGNRIIRQAERHYEKYGDVTHPNRSVNKVVQYFHFCTIRDANNTFFYG